MTVTKADMDLARHHVTVDCGRRPATDTETLQQVKAWAFDFIERYRSKNKGAEPVDQQWIATALKTPLSVVHAAMGDWAPARKSGNTSASPTRGTKMATTGTAPAQRSTRRSAPAKSEVSTAVDTSKKPTAKQAAAEKKQLAAIAAKSAALKKAAEVRAANDAKYQTLASEIVLGDRNTSVAKWRFGWLMHNERGGAKQLPNGRLDEIAFKVNLSGKTIDSWMLMGKTYSTEVKFVSAYDKAGSWTDLRAALTTTPRPKPKAIEDKPAADAQADAKDAFETSGSSPGTSGELPGMTQPQVEDIEVTPDMVVGTTPEVDADDAALEAMYAAEEEAKAATPEVQAHTAIQAYVMLQASEKEFAGSKILGADSELLVNIETQLSHYMKLVHEARGILDGTAA